MAWRFGAAPLLFTLAALAFAYQQFLASIVLRDRATLAAWPANVPFAWVRSVDDGEPLFASNALRLQLAREALAEGNLALAERRVAALPPSPEHEALQGRLAELQGDWDAAVGAYLAAGDSDGIGRRAAALSAAGQPQAAIALEGRLVARLENDPSQVDALADAWLAIGGFEAAQAQQLGTSDPAGSAAAERAAAAFDRAVALAPLSERYLLPAGTQALTVGDLAAAQRYFEQARNADPTAAEAYAGLGETALRRGDRQSAQADLERAERLGPQFPSVRKLAQELRR